MSGGSMGYLYQAVQDARFRRNTALRKAFSAHLDKVALALRAIEWNDSGDEDDTEERAISACLSGTAVLAQCTADAQSALEDLQSAIEDARSAR